MFNSVRVVETEISVKCYFNSRGGELYFSLHGLVDLILVDA